MDILMGHFLGDYVLQNDWMGINKSKSWLICSLHCVIYSLSIALLTWTLDWRLFVVFFQHLIFDKNRKLTQFLLSNHHFKWCTDREKMWLMFFYDNLTHLFTLHILYNVIA